jgi:DNA-binding NarL/FixJ family response regulator/signal transduction histidine kinase
MVVMTDVAGSETILEHITDAFIAMDRDWRVTYVNERAMAQTRKAQGRDVAATELLGKSLWALAPGLVGTRFEHEFRRALREQTVVAFEAYSAPGGRWVDVLVYPSPDGVSVYSHDISARKAAEEELRRRADQQAVVADLGRRALAAHGLQALLDDAVRLMAATLDVELVAIAEAVPGGGELIFRAGVGWSEDAVGTRVARVGPGSLVEYMLRAGEPVIVDDMATDERFTTGAITREHEIVSALSVMIAGPIQPFGTLAVMSTGRRAFSPSEASFVQAAANVLAGAAERHRAHDRLIAVREAERRRIARDLHEEALPDLTHARSLVAEIGGGRAASGELTDALERVGRRLRAAIFDLRLGGERDTPFPELLNGLVAVHRAVAGGHEIEVDVREGVPTGPLGATGIEVLRIVGEALTNVRRHARAARVRVRACGAAGRLRISVADDGRGFEPSGRLAVAGTGLEGMRRRAERLGGVVDVVSDAATGTTVRLDVPLHGAGEGALEQVRVLLVEDHTALLQAMAGMFEREPDFTVVGRARSLAEAREQLHGVDVAVLDLGGLPDGDGADLIAGLRAASPDAHALVLGAGLDRVRTARAIEAGAAAALDKTAHLGEVVDAVRRLRAGQTLLAADEVVELLRVAARRREQEREERRAIESLTPREREVLRALGAGLDSQAVADRLDISIRTERNHVAAILYKLGVHSQLQAVLFGLRHGVIDEP